ncbi:MAG TPA: restriction endonuclease [Myxococcales bacterium]|nr:restriction endonuclease [Deltaproteobacteria bacterium]MBU49877.1 restriction endonuclease [Deltaproteobacteria bacterium]HAA58381.1 restriction endonuclease [Myxococcales bacterium]|tara:strand:+ start:7829 stop:8587 length:759 start_codon:yes stop_codon:yes gene_type:complete
MTIPLLPPDIDTLLTSAVQIFWKSRSSGNKTQGGSRGNVISGKNLDGFLHAVKETAKHCGLSEDCVHTEGRANVTLPGFYRPHKSWDVVVIHKGRLLAAFEFKSQVGSFGNNFNNRSEEAIGSAADLWAAFKNGYYHPDNYKKETNTKHHDPRRPFLGYLMLLQKCERSTKALSNNSPHYNIAPEFENASYAERYKILCERLMEQRLYDFAALALSEKKAGTSSGLWESLSPATDLKQLFAEFAGRIAAAVA